MILDNLAPEDCLPIVIGDGPSLSGSRLGGAPPEGVSPKHSADAHYLLTLALEEDGTQEVSIFLHPDWEDVLFEHSRTLYSQEEEWVELVVHGPSVRSSKSENEPVLPPYPLLLRVSEPDRQGDEGSEAGAPLYEHKLGGRPYFVRYKPKLVDAIQEVEQQGYRQLFQLCFPSPKDTLVHGSWPFADGNFYLYFKLDAGQYRWYYGWLY